MFTRTSRRLANTLYRLQSLKPTASFSVTTPIDLQAQQNDQQIKIYPVDPIVEKRLVLSAYKFIRYYELRGHELSTVDPLSKLYI